MKTFETEKGNIPEGATHTYDHGGSECGYYKLVDGSWFYWDWCKVWLSVVDNQCLYEAIPIPQTNIGTPEEKVGEWVNGDIATYEGKQALVIAYHPHHPSVVIELPDNVYLNVLASELSKPETEAERVERERLEAVEEMFTYWSDDKGDFVAGDDDDRWVKDLLFALHDAGYKRDKL